MFSILDILKKHREEKNKVASAADQAGAPPGDAREGRLSIFSAVNKEMTEEGMRQMAALYDDALKAVKKIYVPEPDGALLKSEMDRLLPEIVTLVSKGNKESLAFILSDYPDVREYLYRHALNVCLLSVELGLQLKYDPSILIDLAESALLHDIGLVGMLDVVMSPRKLDPAEMEKMRQHPKKGSEILSKAQKDWPHCIMESVLQEHERYDGSGYLKGLKAEEIAEFAQLIGLADVYEALVHSRPYRSRFTPWEALNELIKNKGAFSQRMIKALIECVGIFPAGSTVRLNTKETAVVLRLNPLSPLRPVVSVITDSQGAELKIPKEINLTKNYLIFIDESMDSRQKEAHA